jgi:ribosome-binding protein aMBF1 (putative translation factor)
VNATINVFTCDLCGESEVNGRAHSRITIRTQELDACQDCVAAITELIRKRRAKTGPSCEYTYDPPPLPYLPFVESEK